MAHGLIKKKHRYKKHQVNMEVIRIDVKDKNIVAL